MAGWGEGHADGCAQALPSATIGVLVMRMGLAVATRTHLCSSVAQRQSIRLLTGGLLVRIQPEEPISDQDFFPHSLSRLGYSRQKT